MLWVEPLCGSGSLKTFNNILNFLIVVNKKGKL